MAGRRSPTSTIAPAHVTRRYNNIRDRFPSRMSRFFCRRRNNVTRVLRIWRMRTRRVSSRNGRPLRDCSTRKATPNSRGSSLNPESTRVSHFPPSWLKLPLLPRDYAKRDNFAFRVCVSLRTRARARARSFLLPKYRQELRQHEVVRYYDKIRGK